MNPKLYFINRDNEWFRPMAKQNPILDVVMRARKVQVSNIKNYNEYTKNLLQTSNSYEIFEAIDYEYDPICHTFNFNKLIKVDEFEANNIQGYVCKDFDPNKKYEFNSVNKPVEISKTKTNSYIEDLLELHPVPSLQECGMHISKFTWTYLLRNIKKSKNMMLVGPTGTGKTELVIKAAQYLDMPCHVYDMGSMHDPLTDLLGSHRLENGSSIFDYAKFTQDIQEKCVIVLDELSRAPLIANNILFPCLDSRRELPVEIADSKNARNIKIHPECVFIATANIGLEYSGTNEIDAALMNRFLPLRLEYMAPADEIQVLISRTGISEDMSSKIVNFANRMREEYKEQNITKSCSTRETIAMAEMVVDGFSPLEAISAIIINKYPDSNDEECSYINKILISL